MEDFKVYSNKKKVILYFFGSLAFVLFGLFILGLFFMSLYKGLKIDYDLRTIYLLLISVGCILFFGFILFFLLVKIFSRKPEIVLTDEGIIDNSTAMSGGLIKWRDVRDVKIYNFKFNNQYGRSSQKFLGIVPKDINKFIESQKTVKKGLLMVNRGLVEYPINIPQNLLKIPLEEVEKEIKKRWKPSKN